VGADGTLRSDLRQQIEAPEAFIESLRGAQVPEAAIDRIRRDRSAILNLPMALPVTERVREGPAGTELGTNLRGAPVLRSQVSLDVPDLGWVLVAEIETAEALAPVRALQTRILTLGGVVGALFFVVAGWLGASVTQPVLELARTVARVGEGQRGATVPVRSDDELGALAQAFNRMSADLERTTVSKSELEVLAGRLITAQEDERRRVGRELHDDVVQRLAATAIEVGRLERVSSLDDTRAGLAHLKGTVVTLSKDVHQLSRQIHPAVLDEVGLAAAVERECRAFMERGGPPVDLRVAGTLDGLPKGAQLAVYRITQEGLRNVWQHADASEVSLRLQRDDSAVAIDLSDNGRGFDRADARGPAGLGLASMEERARLLGGRLTVTSTPGVGTRVHALLPITGPDDATAHPAG
jgi:signal transduction histidine kinase